MKLPNDSDASVEQEPSGVRDRNGENLEAFSVAEKGTKRNLLV
jgi:hypothetical protein